MLYYRKKESNKKHYIKIIILVALILLSSLNPMASNISSDIVLTITKPFNKAMSFVTKELQDLIDTTFGSKPNRDMVRKLEFEVQKKDEEINRLKSIVAKSDVLKKEYEFMDKNDYIYASVIAIDESSFFHKFTIDKGRNQGVEKGDIIVAAYLYGDDYSQGALVGRVSEANANTSKVETIMDDRFNLTFKHLDSQSFGVINARFDGLLEGYLLDSDAEIKKGDKVFTSGIGGVYQEGIYIGEIADVEFSSDNLRKLVKIKSPINFKKVYDVFVISSVGDENE